MKTFRTLKSLLGSTLLIAASLGYAHAGPHIQHWNTANGTRVYFVESNALPLIDLRIDFTAGSAYDPADKAGLAGMTRGLLDTGASGLSEQQIAEQIADSGARFGGGTDNDRSGFTVRTLSSSAERDTAIALAARLLAHPTFPPEILERERARSIAALREAMTRPGFLAEQRFNSAIYGSHPYGSDADIASLTAISRDDLLSFHQRFYTAGNATVTIVGDVSRSDAEAIALALTRELPAGSPPPALPQPVQPQQRVEHISNPSAQTHILAGMPGMSREDPDYYPLLVGNYILGGGGFVSRLTSEIREKRGFAYSVYSYFAPYRVAGPFQISLQTRGDQADEAVKVMRQVLAEFVAAGPTAEELKAARDNLINGFGLRLDANSKILDYVAMIGFYGLPLDWLDTYTQHVAAVTAAQIRDAFSRRVRPEHLVVITAGGDNSQTPAQTDTSAAPAPKEDMVN